MLSSLLVRQWLGSQENVSVVEKRLEIQNLRIDGLLESMEKADKVASDNSELLQNLMIGIENMGDNLRQCREDMEDRKHSEHFWQEDNERNTIDFRMN